MEPSDAVGWQKVHTQFKEYESEEGEGRMKEQSLVFFQVGRCSQAIPSSSVPRLLASFSRWSLTRNLDLFFLPVVS